MINYSESNGVSGDYQPPIEDEARKRLYMSLFNWAKHVNPSLSLDERFAGGCGLRNKMTRRLLFSVPEHAILFVSCSRFAEQAGPVVEREALWLKAKETRAVGRKCYVLV